jgi:glutamate/tyrosine decarboxylase-like PLP-dependent enzyme
VGNAGTVNTGAVDALPELASICETEKLWFHVDGAFGALAAIAPNLKPLVRGMERADSLAFDLHKWMYMPYDVGCALVRWPEQHRATFVSPADYLAHLPRGLTAGPVWFSEYGVQLSRGFRALKVWMSLKEHGVSKYGRLVEQNCEQAKYLASLVERAPELELMTPASLNIVCFRFAPRGVDEGKLDAINEEILFGLQESGTAVPSSTLLGGRFALRVCICNHRTRREDLDLLVREVVARGRAVAAEPAARS